MRQVRRTSIAVVAVTFGLLFGESMLSSSLFVAEATTTRQQQRQVLSTHRVNIRDEMDRHSNQESSLSTTTSASTTTSTTTTSTTTRIEDTFLFRRLMEQPRMNVEENEDDYDDGADLPCDLECKNGGTCRYIPGNIQSWKKYARTGILIQRCECPPGYGGVGCEVPVERCIEETHTCELSGVPCQALPDGTYTCACHVADAMDSNLAGLVCRKWNTEYCAGQFDETASVIYLCTNGGKCQSDFIGAAIAPGDLSVNLQYQDAGCVCNQNFYGPHCEFLRFDPAKNIAMRQQQKNQSNHEDGIQTNGIGSHTVMALMGAAIFGVLLSMFAYRRYKRGIRRTPTVLGRDAIFKDDEEGGHFSDHHVPVPLEMMQDLDPYSDAIMAAHELVDIDINDDDDKSNYHLNRPQEQVHDPLEPPSATIPDLTKASSLLDSDEHYTSSTHNDDDHNGYDDDCKDEKDLGIFT